MRMLLKMTAGIEAGNRAARDGKMGKVIARVIDQLHPESSWFMPEHGCRTAYFVFDMKDPSSVAAIAEPLFQDLDAKVEINPVMNFEDLKKGLERVSQTR